MSPLRKTLLFLLLFVLVGIILLTWGSVGSAMLTMALIIGLGYTARTKLSGRYVHGRGVRCPWE